MDIAGAFADAVDSVRGAALVEPVGARTHAELGHAAATGSVLVRAASGLVRHDPDDLTVTVLAGTPVHELDAALAEHRQFVPLDPRDTNATVGGTISSGLSGLRRLGCGPLRDQILEVRFVTGYGELVKGGGPTVKNVTGYDVPRLLVGSLGTLGVIVQVTLRCRPAPAVSEWWATSAEPSELIETLFRPTSVLSDRERSYALLTGEPADVEFAHSAMADAHPLERFELPDASHRGRISVNPSALDAVTDALDDIAGIDLAWVAEWGVGTVHVATGNPTVLSAARVVAEAHGGWLLREAGAPDLDPFGVARPNRDLQYRVKAALDPDDKLARGRFR